MDARTKKLKKELALAAEQLKVMQGLLVQERNTSSNRLMRLVRVEDKLRETTVGLTLKDHSTSRDKILWNALYAFGQDSSEDQCVEECAELIIALKHWRRGRIPVKQVQKELADVLLCVEQMKLAFGQHDILKMENGVLADLKQQVDKGIRKERMSCGE